MESDVDFCAFDYHSDDHGDPTVIAIYLRGAANSLHASTGSPKITILAHSFGGLIARYYAEELRLGDVDRLITIGTPHAGTILANFIADPIVREISSGDIVTVSLRDNVKPESAAVAAMRSGSSFITELNALPPAPGTQYVSLLGVVDPFWNLVTKYVFDDLRSRACEDPFSSKCRAVSNYETEIVTLLNGSNDGLVSASSQFRAGSCPAQVTQPLMHSPQLRYVNSPAGAILQLSPTETQATDVLLAALGVAGVPICPRP
jgi:triacylglycerol esterase/lipase EstA (alpha/beta hydrolase family)